MLLLQSFALVGSSMLVLDLVMHQEIKKFKDFFLFHSSSSVNQSILLLQAGKVSSRLLVLVIPVDPQATYA